MRPDEHGLGCGGDPDERQERAEDQDQQHGRVDRGRVPNTWCFLGRRDGSVAQSTHPDDRNPWDLRSADDAPDGCRPNERPDRQAPKIPAISNGGVVSSWS